MPRVPGRSCSTVVTPASEGRSAVTSAGHSPGIRTPWPYVAWLAVSGVRLVVAREVDPLALAGSLPTAWVLYDVLGSCSRA